MTVKEVIDGLTELISDRESFIEKDDPDSIFAHDAEVLREAIKLINATQGIEPRKAPKHSEGQQGKIIVYYRDREGKIVLHHGNRGENTLDELAELAAGYNRDNDRTGRTAYIELAEDGSLLAYLFEKAKERMAANKDLLREAIDSIENALQCVHGLED